MYRAVASAQLDLLDAKVPRQLRLVSAGPSARSVAIDD